MRSTPDLLIQYARYHRDPRNIATHLVGIPMIVLAVAVLLARIPLPGSPWPLNGAWLAWALSTAWYLGHGRGAAEALVSLAVGALVWLAGPLAQGDLTHWLSWGLGLFVLGWMIQFLGHHYEGRKPAFVDDLVGLLVGPLFVTAELLFALGLCQGLKAEIEAAAGPVRRRDPAPL